MSNRESGRPSFVYDAFISYRRVDRDVRWAEWLIDALEQYRVPKALQKRGLPKRLQKIFRDDDEFSASADVSSQVKKALAASRFLIVICSAFTPRSKWVQREIEIFNELGRGDQVLALLTEGEPEDSFPAHMLERYRQAVGPDGTVHTVKEGIEPLAADVRPRSGISSARQKRLALIRLVAPILGVNFDDLQQRERERERNRQLTWSALAAIFILLAAGGGLGYWEMVRPKTTHYRQIVWRWGIPEGLDRLDEEARSHASESYRFVRHGKMLDVQREGSGGALKENDSGQAHWVISYGAGERVERMRVFDGIDRLIREDHFERGLSSDSLIISSKRDNVDFAQPNKLAFVIEELESKADITRKELTLNEQGYAIKSRYQNHYGAPQHDTSGSFGQNHTYTPEGLPLRVAWVGPDGKEIALKNGIRATTYTYDSNRNVARTTIVGSDDKPFDGPDGYAYFLSKYDRWGNTISTEYYSAGELPALNTTGYSKIIQTYDDRGNKIERAYYDVDGKLTPGLAGNAISRAKFDDRGNSIEDAFLGLDGKPALNRRGIAKIGYKYDSQNRPIEEVYFGLRDELTFGSFSVAGMQQQFDSQSNIVELRFLGAHGEPVSHLDYKVAKIKNSYNARSQWVGTSYFDVDDQPALNRDGISSSNLAYDQRGNLIEAAYFGVDGRLKVNGDNCARVRQAFDDSGMPTYRECLGINGDLALTLSGYARIKFAFDNRGNLKKLAYFGVNGEPKLVNGIAGMSMEYDGRGNLAQAAYFGVDGNAATDAKGIAKTNHIYNSRGQLIRADYFGLEGEPTLGTIGCASEQQEFDDRGRVVRIICLGFAGSPVNRMDGYAKATNGYDARGNMIELARFDAEGKPAINSTSGVWKQTYAYDSRNVQIGAVYFDKLGREIPVDVVFSDIEFGSTAERIGLKPGDRILSYDGRKPTSEDQQISLVTDFSGRASRILIVRRGEQILTFEVAPGRLGASLDVVRAEIDVIDTGRVRKN